MSKNLLYGRPEGDTVGAGAILRDILDRRDILARVFGGGAGPTPREVVGQRPTAGLEVVPPGTLHQKTTLRADGSVLTPTVDTFLAGGPQRGGELVGKLAPDGMVVRPDGMVVGRRNPKSGAVIAAPAPSTGPSGHSVVRGHDQFSAGGPPPSEYGGMAGPGHGLLATQPLRVTQPKGAELYEADQGTLNTFPWHKGQHHAADHRASERPSFLGSSLNPAERAWALDIANRRA